MEPMRVGLVGCLLEPIKVQEEGEGVEYADIFKTKSESSCWELSTKNNNNNSNE